MMQLALFRYPMGESLSSDIHQAFGKQCDLTVNYQQIAVEPGKLKEAIDAFRQQGGIGANVTMPLKEEAFQLCEEVTPRALEAKSVNTLYWKEEVLCGDNTDGIGFYNDITNNLQQTFKDKTVCILGAGGAVSGIMAYIASMQPKDIIVCNRTLERAKTLCERFSHLPVTPKAISLDALNATTLPLEWIINGTPNQPDGMQIASHLVQHAQVYELAYSKESPQTFFAQWAQAHGARDVWDGIGMLVEQAGEGFKIWSGGYSPERQSVIERLRQRFMLNRFTLK